jgi:hypothetical protein
MGICVLWTQSSFIFKLFLGSSLAQDRGRLEAKIETLNSEVITLKKTLNVRFVSTCNTFVYFNSLLIYRGLLCLSLIQL